MMVRRLLFVICALTISMTALADRGGFYYTNWEFSATISANDTWSINELEEVYFEEPRHGIYRYIPYRFKANLNEAPDGEAQQTPDKFYSIDVDILKTTGAEVEQWEDDNDNVVIRYGSEDFEITGEKAYTVAYTYEYPDDRIEARDFIYHTIKPANIDEEVKRFTFTLIFEKALPQDIAQRVKFYTGERGRTTELTHIENLTVTQNLISGTVYKIEPNQAITLYAELPQGYWEDTKKVPVWPSKLFCWISILLALWIIYLEVFERQVPPSKSVEFYPPDEITPSEVGKIIDDSTDPIDLTALIPWLAQKGYLQIEEVKKKGFFKDKTDIKLTKLKELPNDAEEYQQCIMDMLFKEGETEQLMSEFGRRPTKVEAAKKALDRHFTGDRELTKWMHAGKMILLTITSSLAFMLGSVEKFIKWDLALSIISIWFVSFMGAWIFRSHNSVKDPFRAKWKTTALFVLRLVAFLWLCLCIWAICWSDGVNEFCLSLSEGAVMAICCYIACEMSGRLIFDTAYRQSLRGRLLGFKEFIETADRDRLQMLVDRDPEYFYSVLPYAMIFELTDKWVEQFKQIDVKEVGWYHASNAYGNFGYISNLSSSLNSNINSAITTSSASSSGGSGGFSGGGGGGGGGGSW